MNSDKKGLIYAMITAFFWGFLAIALKIATNLVDPITIVWSRFFIAFVALLIYNSIYTPRELQILYKPPKQLIIAALALGLNYLGFMMGIKYTSPSTAQVIIQTGPVTLALAGIFIFGEQIRKKQLIGFVVAITGFTLFYSQQLKSMFFNPSDLNKGVLFTFMGAMAWTLYAIMQKKLVEKYSTATLNLFLFGLPALIYTPFIDLSPMKEHHPTWWLLIIFLGINTIIAYGCMSLALKYTQANKVSTIVITNPVITFITMSFFTYFEVPWIQGEHFNLKVWAGALIFILGAIIVIRAGKRRVSKS